MFVALMLPAAQAGADWRNDYDRGLKAIDAGRWAEAESAFRAALGDDPQSNARKRFQGVVIKAYVPHYYAGLAAYRQGNCQRALEYWNNASSSAVVAGLADLRGVQSSAISDCNTRLASNTRPPPPVATTVTPPPPAAATPTTTKPPASTPTRPVATTQTSPATPTKPPAEVAKPPVAATSPAPAALVAALDSFLAGRYAAVTQFDPATLADGRSRAQGHLLRAASRFTLAQLAGGDTTTQLDQARRDVRAARSANASLTPDETLFSPRFRTFWRESR